MKLFQCLSAALTCAAVVGAAVPLAAQPAPGAPPGPPAARPVGKPEGGPKKPADIKKALQDSKAHQGKSLDALRGHGPKAEDDDDGAARVGQATRRRLNSALKQRRDEMQGAFGKFREQGPKAAEERKARQEERKKWRDQVREAFKEGPDKLAAAIKERNAKIGDRRTEHRETLRKLWGSLHELQPLRAEFRTHAWRMARLERMYVLATEKKDAKLVGRIDKLIENEEARHDQRLTALTEAVGSDLDGKASEPAPSASANAAAEGDDK